MTAQIIDGKALSKRLRVGFRERVERLKARGVSPGLAVILVGDNPASRVYVGNKIKACEECGVRSLHVALAADVSEVEVLATIQRLNDDDSVHGILVQLPLPPHIQIARVLEAISVHKDVDGFHLYNVGALVTGNSIFPPCTPYGVQLLLDTTGIDVAGKNVVVVGASNIVGKPMGLMLLQREATVTICHAKTRDLAQHTILADILIVAAGKPGLIVPQMVKEGAIVIDVGINRLPDGRIVGDVCFDEVKEKASWITPVPGGVGPMTVTMLIENTLRSAERAFKAADEDEFQEWEAPIVKSP
ncbi:MULTISPECIES: bifunctional methylenetetrahydrofolate dehydrogenase/methenyltetrahydrofolate cyclohydrolase FolD [Hydrogenophaga]|uniref:bifunctional methylenetetrahydrofolate dehydrogenase/methenyltetrahydrofolate cyclohydrolase FolD n=1 Tax=Hydrogenophaga TaxID=47420 RepID=UPI001CFBFD95|nr:MULTISPECIES: bifunctional methylenetetrahydrofolate dehydrogenase/methenyltetrahydrofolate cyclohydrolase FolD [Hydrogenophaga]MDO9033532.1 bifunctional methylenetetrahydrofolate dehydrogenase/methenyltetrahydrofolate cyclohydrolase FolD [Hydrogenophaga sp.]UCU95308.1 bifunctional methylenetetrahydrofolate dehydrogenase/methenyltetrahydrofolate cyclohydrolase FolD [Hydrogenophaga taeniospiralis]